MRILIAPDKFKGSLGAAAVAAAIAEGLREVLPAAEIVCLPVADGGEGTAEAIGGEEQECTVCDPLGRAVTARYRVAAERVAVLEMSQASGLWRLRPNEHHPLAASTFGTGQMLLAAIGLGVEKIIIGLGGSATNDGGSGLARALGFRLLDAKGAEIGERVPGLARLQRIEAPRGLKLPPMTAAADVRNPLLGERGATRVFGPQKGVTPEQTATLERALERLADVAAETFGRDFRATPGAGAAGGLGFGLMTFCGATVRPGFEIVAEQIGLREAIRAADIVITGEGRLDAQTAEGKAPAGVAAMARAAGKRVFAIVGTVEDIAAGSVFDAVYEVARPPVEIADALARPAEFLRERARELANEQLLRSAP